MQTTNNVPLDRAILVLLAIHEKKSIVEIEGILGLSRVMVQRYLGTLHEEGYYQAEQGETGRKTRNRARSLTDAGKAFLRDYGHTV